VLPVQYQSPVFTERRHGLTCSQSADSVTLVSCSGSNWVTLPQGTTHAQATARAWELAHLTADIMSWHRKWQRCPLKLAWIPYNGKMNVAMTYVG
jgi:hypothetical protein